MAVRDCAKYSNELVNSAVGSVWAMLAASSSCLNAAATVSTREGKSSSSWRDICNTFGIPVIVGAILSRSFCFSTGNASKPSIVRAFSPSAVQLFSPACGRNSLSFAYARRASLIFTRVMTTNTSAVAALRIAAQPLRKLKTRLAKAFNGVSTKKLASLKTSISMAKQTTKMMKPITQCQYLPNRTFTMGL